MKPIKKRSNGSGVANMIAANRSAAGNPALATSQDTVLVISIDKIRRDPNQPRMVFDEVALNELALSLKSHGQTDPIQVRFNEEDNTYILNAGERRWRAAKIAGLATLRAVLIDPNQDHATSALVDNLQRVNLLPLEVALSIENILSENKELSAKTLGEQLGMSEQVMSRYRRVAALPPVIQKSYFEITEASDRPSMSKLYEIAQIDDPLKQSAMWDRVKDEGITTKELRALRAGEADTEIGTTEQGLPDIGHNDGTTVSPTKEGTETRSNKKSDVAPATKSIGFLERHSEIVAEKASELSEQDISDLREILSRITKILETR